MFAHDGALLSRYSDLPRVEALSWHKKRPSHHLRRPLKQRYTAPIPPAKVPFCHKKCSFRRLHHSKQIRRPLHLLRRPSGPKNILIVDDGALPSRDDASPGSKAPLWHKQALFSLMTATFETDTGPSHQRRRPSDTKRRPLCASFSQVRCSSGRDRHMTVPIRPFIRFDQTLLAAKVKRSQ